MSEEFYASLSALDWQIELGADECIGDAPVNRFEAVEEKTARAAPVASAPAAASPTAPDPVEITQNLAAQCSSLEELRTAIEGFDGCALKQGARKTVFADGLSQARLMIIGEAPGRDEDAQGVPFVGPAGQLLDRMFAAIGLSRTAQNASEALYITNVMPWRPPQNRDPSAEEIAMMRPFLDRHIALADPDILVLMGNAACRSMLENPRGITSLRGNWHEVGKVPAMPMFHPAALLRDPSKKAASWRDLQAIRRHLK